MLDGVVTRIEGPVFWVRVNDKDEIQCTLRGKLKKKRLRVTSLLVAGDEVSVVVGSDGTGVIDQVLPRRSQLSRPGFHGYEHVIAANVDLLVIVQAARQPAFKRRLVERYLAIARHGGMDSLVVVNKCDLERLDVVKTWAAPLRDAGVRVLLTSAPSGLGLEELRSALSHKTSVLSGPSGVGKSSLINALCPDFGIRTQAVADWNQKGRHTTTSSRLYELPGGISLIDTPGIRELALFEDSEDSVTGVFPEIGALAHGCKFTDCSHSHEPGCAVKAAVSQGLIDKDRYNNYIRLARRR